jgi:hypothetical protein
MREREAALAAAEGSCPRCGAWRAPDHRYCLDCGLALPRLRGRIATLRRWWLRRIGWYPGDFVWTALGALLAAAAAAAGAVALSEARAPARGVVFRASGTVPVGAPVAAPPATGTAAPAAKPGPRAPVNGRLTWPANETGWTVVLVSYPKLNGRDAALATAARAARGLNRVGILDSSLYASLQPGYFVVFSGVYSSEHDADASVPTARQAGFRGAYTRQIAR